MENEVIEASSGKLPLLDANPPYAGIFKRFWAGILDLIVCYFIFVFVLLALIALGVHDTQTEVAFPLTAILIFWLYFAGFESSSAKATPGKKASRIVVTDARGAQISFVRASLRCAGKLVILVSVGLGLFVSVFDHQRRGIDDFIAGTRVYDVEATTGSGPRSWWRKAIGPILLFALIGLLAKTALDAQRDFQLRSRVLGLLADIRTGLQAPCADYYETNRRWPKISDLPFTHSAIRTLEIDADGTLVLHLIQPEVALLRLTPSIDKEGELSWRCRVKTEHAKLFPSNCRP